MDDQRVTLWNFLNKTLNNLKYLSPVREVSFFFPPALFFKSDLFKHNVTTFDVENIFSVREQSSV